MYKKTDIPLRFYDVKGIEDEATVDLYFKILEKYNGKNADSLDKINAIFYLVKYDKDTVLDNLVDDIFEKLIEFDIPILFIITHCDFNPYTKSKNPKANISKINKKKTIENNIKDYLKSKFKDNKKENEYDNFIKNFVKFYYVNLVREYKDNPIPVFGIDKIVSFFRESVPIEDWKNLDSSCDLNDEKNCKKYCEKNPFLKYYLDFNKINKRNKEEALNYLKGLKAGAFFSGWIPGVDIGMEYYYRKIFKEKLKYLYGFTYEKAEKTVKEYGYDKKEIKLKELNDVEKKEKKGNSKNKENEIEKKVDEKVDNTLRNTGASLRGLFEVGNTMLKFTISTGLKTVSWVLLPVTVVGSGIWSLLNVSKDCNDILNIFEKAFTPLRFETVKKYSQSFQVAILYFEEISKKIIDDDKKFNDDA